jgi:hypothetical protein
MWGARTGPMVSTNSCRQADLGPRRVGIHFKKLACRSDAVDEVPPNGSRGLRRPLTIDRPSS